MFVISDKYSCMHTLFFLIFSHAPSTLPLFYECTILDNQVKRDEHLKTLCDACISYLCVNQSNRQTQANGSAIANTKTLAPSIRTSDAQTHTHAKHNISHVNK
jgi:hypothetical protein